MGYAVYEVGERDAGYGVPATCDHPDCNERIDRGLAHICGDEPATDSRGCNLYFCEKHLQHTSKGAAVRLDGGKLTVRDGPFTEAKEVIGGFTIMELPSKEAAIEEARKFMELHRQLWPGWSGECEVRLMYGDNEHP